MYIHDDGLITLIYLARVRLYYGSLRKMSTFTLFPGNSYVHAISVSFIDATDKFPRLQLPMYFHVELDLPHLCRFVKLSRSHGVRLSGVTGKLARVMQGSQASSNQD